MKRIKGLFAVMTVNAVSISGQAVSKADLKKLDRYYSSMVEDWDVPGVSIRVVKDGRIVFSCNCGVLQKGFQAPGPQLTRLD